MFKFESFTLVTWLYMVALALGGGGAVAALLLSGLEETREDLQGLAAALWAKLCRWSFRIAILLGLVLLAMVWNRDGNPFRSASYLYWKLPMVILLLVASESAPKALAAGKRGGALLALVLFLLASFVTVNQGAFKRSPRPLLAPEPAGMMEALH